MEHEAFERLHDLARCDFASDNYAGMHPRVLEALAVANGGHQGAYGADDYTQRLQEVLARQFGEDARVYAAFNGTGANVLALQSMLPRWGAVIAATTAHIHVDEGGAPERTGGLKLLTVETEEGKLTPELIDREAWGFGDEHRAQAGVVSITQSSELGTLYTPDEIATITEHAHRLGLKVHLDGARLANAAAALDVPLRAITTDVGVDAISLGGTKNGAMLAEAVVELTPGACAGLGFSRKYLMQLSSKMRFVSAQLLALYDGELWRENASRANAAARRLRAGIEAEQARGMLAEVEFTQPTQVNAVFATLPADVANRLRESYRFYDWDETRGEVRWMCSFDTRDTDVDAFVTALVAATDPTSSTAGAGVTPSAG